MDALDGRRAVECLLAMTFGLIMGSQRGNESGSVCVCIPFCGHLSRQVLARTEWQLHDRTSRAE